MQNIAEKIRELPPELQREVEDFVNFLMEKKGGEAWEKASPRLGWHVEGIP